MGKGGNIAKIFFPILGIAVILIGVSFFGTSTYSLRPVVCYELFGRENVATSMGASLLYEAVAQLISAPAVGK